jgi:hypothetical protein
MERPLIILGQREPGKLEAIYVGIDGVEFEAAWTAAVVNPEFDSVARFQFPTPGMTVHPRANARVKADAEPKLEPTEEAPEKPSEAEATQEPSIPNEPEKSKPSAKDQFFANNKKKK